MSARRLPNGSTFQSRASAWCDKMVKDYSAKATIVGDHFMVTLKKPKGKIIVAKAEDLAEEIHKAVSPFAPAS